MPLRRLGTFDVHPIGLGAMPMSMNAGMTYPPEDDAAACPTRCWRPPRVAERVRIPMLPGWRSMNLTNAAAVASDEAWRQLGFPGGA